jgi:predicted RNA binding protein YcfA (HicA-like mRNA interferase family)
MNPVFGREFARIIERRGWTLLRVNGSHHIFGRAGEQARLSVPIHGTKPLKLGLQRHLAKLAGLSDADLP